MSIFLLKKKKKYLSIKKILYQFIILNIYFLISLICELLQRNL